VDTLRPPSGIRWGLFGGYDGEFTGLGSRLATSFTQVVQAGVERPEALRLLQLGGVEHVAYLGRSAPAGFELVTTFATPLACPLLLLRVPAALPRAYVVGREREVGGDALAAALDPGFEPHDEVLLSHAASSTAGGSGPGTAQIVARSSDTLTVAAKLQAPGVLVVTEAFDDGWSADVDGVPSEVLRANGLFRAVRLGRGEHRVLFRHRPCSVRTDPPASAPGPLAAAALALAVAGPRIELGAGRH
jgi:hypothetical protein